MYPVNKYVSLRCVPILFFMPPAVIDGFAWFKIRRERKIPGLVLTKVTLTKIRERIIIIIIIIKISVLAEACYARASKTIVNHNTFYLITEVT
jgi:hypothetical protein